MTAGANLPGLARAPGKLMLLGEYAVLEGAPAVVAAVDRFAVVSASGPAARSMVVDAPEVLQSPATLDWLADSLTSGDFAIDERLLLVRSVLAGMLDRTGATPLPATLAIDTSAFFASAGAKRHKLGFGSSAAVTTSLVALLAHRARGEAAPADWIFSRSRELHRAAQGVIGSGADIAASCFGGVVRYATHGDLPQITPLAVPAGLHLTVVWTGESASTPMLLRRLAQFREDSPGAYSAALSPLAQLAERGASAWQRGDIAEVLTTTDLYERALGEFGARAGLEVVTGRHAAAAAVARSHGAVYKPSGAGGGDLGIGLSASREGALIFQAALARAGLEVVPVSIATYGVSTS